MTKEKTFGALLARLRSERGLSQAGLAMRAGVHSETIAKVEQNKRKWHKGNAARVLKILNSIHELSLPDHNAFCQYVGLNIAPPQWTYRTPEAKERLHRMVDQLIFKMGTEHVEMILRTLVAISERLPSFAAERMLTEDGRTMTVHHPPVQRKGHTEETIVDYSLPPEAPAASRQGAPTRLPRRIDMG